MTRCLAALGLLACILTVDARPQTAPPAVVKILELYLEGREDEAVRTAAAIADLGPVRVRFVQDVPVWIRSDPEKTEARRAAAAAFLLELTHARLETDWGRLVDLIEWICVDLRSGNPSRTFERAWYVASAALAGRARARVWLLGEYAVLPHQPPPRRAPTPPKNPSPQHLIHALDRFPDDPELRLARIVAWTWGRDGEPYRNLTARATTFLTSRRSPAQPIKALETLVEDPSVGAEALVRIGQLHFAAADAAGALRAFELARPRAASPAVRYLASFLAGRALEALKRPAEAIEQYRRALEVLPDAESAAIALASLQFVGEDRDAAVALLNRAFASPAAADDPGRLVGYGSYMHWPALRTAMRAELRR